MLDFLISVAYDLYWSGEEFLLFGEELFLVGEAFLCILENSGHSLGEAFLLEALSEFFVDIPNESLLGDSERSEMVVVSGFAWGVRWGVW
jgi:hypothetical protein